MESVKGEQCYFTMGTGYVVWLAVAKFFVLLLFCCIYVQKLHFSFIWPKNVLPHLYCLPYMACGKLQSSWRLSSQQWLPSWHTSILAKFVNCTTNFLFFRYFHMSRGSLQTFQSYQWTFWQLSWLALSCSVVIFVCLGFYCVCVFP